MTDHQKYQQGKKHPKVKFRKNAQKKHQPTSDCLKTFNISCLIKRLIFINRSNKFCVYEIYLYEVVPKCFCKVKLVNSFNGWLLQCSSMVYNECVTDQMTIKVCYFNFHFFQSLENKHS